MIRFGRVALALLSTALTGIASAAPVTIELQDVPAKLALPAASEENRLEADVSFDGIPVPKARETNAVREVRALRALCMRFHQHPSYRFDSRGYSDELRATYLDAAAARRFPGRRGATPRRRRPRFRGGLTLRRRNPGTEAMARPGEKTLARCALAPLPRSSPASCGVPGPAVGGLRAACRLITLAERRIGLVAAAEPGTLERLGSELVCEDRGLCIIDLHQRLSAPVIQIFISHRL